MSKPGDYYCKPPMSHTLEEVIKYAKAGKREYCCIHEPLINVPLDHIILDELHLLLRITDVLLSNLIEDAMELDDKEDNIKKRGEPKGIHLQKLVNTIHSCGVTFNIWDKTDGDGKSTGKKDWTSLMGDEKKKLLKLLPEKLQATPNVIHSDTASTVVKIWQVTFNKIIRKTFSLQACNDHS